jgi:hypothetical protein
MSAAVKATVIALAVGMLALVAGKTAYTSTAGSAATPAHMLQEPARDEAPVVGVDTRMTDRNGNVDLRMLAAGPAGASAPEMQLQEAAKPMASPAQQDEPVATF